MVTQLSIIKQNDPKLSDTAQNTASYIPRHINNTEFTFCPAISLLLTNTMKTFFDWLTDFIFNNVYHLYIYTYKTLNHPRWCKTI